MSTGYEAAVNAVAVFDRADRACLAVGGRAPRQMLNGIMTGTMPPEPEMGPDGLLGGLACYTAALTPKGKMVSDGRLWLRGAEEEQGFVLEVPTAGREGLLKHLRKFLPPRMASVEEPTGRLRVASVVGPDAAERLASLPFGGRVRAADLSGLAEGAWRQVGEDPEERLTVVRWADVWPEAFDVLGSDVAIAAFLEELVAAGATHAEPETWDTLRIEAGRPAFGVEMDESTIPVEAGIHERAIDYTKGCYTGQEVIVRIRDRGHVNRSLRLVRLGDATPPDPGTGLFTPDSEKPVGLVASAVRSPRYGETIALAYVRRGVKEGALSLSP